MAIPSALTPEQEIARAQGAAQDAARTLRAIAEKLEAGTATLMELDVEFLGQDVANGSMMEWRGYGGRLLVSWTDERGT